MSTGSQIHKLNHNHLYYFHIVAHEGSLAKGAQRLRLSQSTLSEQIRALERSLGMRLFDRKDGKMRLNEAGRAAFEQTHVMFRASERLVQQLKGQAPRQIVLSMGVASTVSRSLAARVFLPLFDRDDVLVRIRHGDYDYMLKDLLAFEIDVLLSDTLPPDPESKGIGHRLVQSPSLVVVASPDMAKRVSRLPNDLDGLPYMAYTMHSRYRLEIDQYFQEHGIAPPIFGEVDDVIVMMAVAEQGLAFAILPEPVVHESAEDGRLAILGPLDDLRSEVHALYNEKEPSEIVMEIVDTLCADESSRAADSRQ